MSENRVKYLNILVNHLVEGYHLSAENAHQAVYSSTVAQMMYNDKDAEWQMHQPINDAVEEIYCQYKGLKMNYIL